MTLLKNRCKWVTSDPLYIAYHDNEWGRPVKDDQVLFEFLILEGMQAGLSWLTILKRRENYRAAFDQFDYEKIARYDAKKIELLMNNEGIIRHRLKVQSVVNNAQAFIDLKNEYSSFASYLWGFVDDEPIINHWEDGSCVPATTPISEKLSKDLKKRGFKFIGSTICYAFMQAVGLVNDHTVDCFCYQQK